MRDQETYEMMNLRIFADGKEVGTAATVQVEQPTIVAEPTEDSEYIATPSAIHGAATLQADAETAKGLRRLMESMRISRKERRKMFHAVTHGGAVALPATFSVEQDDGTYETIEDRTVYINRPAQLRRFLAAIRIRFHYHIIPRFDPTDKIILSQFGKCNE